jgi:hypothetical protein
MQGSDFVPGLDVQLVLKEARRSGISAGRADSQPWSSAGYGTRIRSPEKACPTPLPINSSTFYVYVKRAGRSCHMITLCLHSLHGQSDWAKPTINTTSGGCGTGTIPHWAAYSNILDSTDDTGCRVDEPRQGQLICLSMRQGLRFGRSVLHRRSNNPKTKKKAECHAASRSTQTE